MLQPHYSDLEMEMMVSSLGINPSVGYSSSAFDPMIEMVRSASAPAAEEKIADMEGSASSPMDTEIAPEPFVAADESAFETPGKVSFLLSSFLATNFLAIMRILTTCILCTGNSSPWCCSSQCPSGWRCYLPAR